MVSVIAVTWSRMCCRDNIFLVPVVIYLQVDDILRDFCKSVAIGSRWCEYLMFVCGRLQGVCVELLCRLSRIICGWSECIVLNTGWVIISSVVFA